jgi:hypothetical protein
MDQVRCQNLADGLAVSAEQEWDLTQWNVLVAQNGCTKKCSDVKGSLEKVKTTFVCRRCLGSMKDDDLVEQGPKVFG